MGQRGTGGHGRGVRGAASRASRSPNTSRNAASKTSRSPPARAQGGAQRVVGVGAGLGVHRPEGAVRREQLSEAHAHAAGPQGGREQAERPLRRAPRARAEVGAGAGGAGVDTLEHPGLSHPLDVLAHLERDAERALEPVVVEREQRLGPGDRLPHAGQLVEILPAEARDGGADAPGHGLGHVGRARVDDLALALRARVVDPVVEAAALEGVVELARAVRREHDHGPAAGHHRAQLGDRDLEVGEELEQEGLELVVRAVHLVDEQDDGTLVLEGLQERSPEQELPREEASRCPVRRRPPPRAAPGAGAGSPSRTGPGGGRSPRGTGGG